MITLFIPYVNRPDLLEKAVASTLNSGTDVVVINNSGKEMDVPSGCHESVASVPLTFAQTQNWMTKLSKKWGESFYLWMHSDAAAEPGTIQKLVEIVRDLEAQGRQWGVVFTAYDTLAAYNTEAFLSIGGWDTALEWYASDPDVYRRIRLAGYEIIESGLPVHHEPSSTLNADPLIRKKVDLMFPCRIEYYEAKWGGDIGLETYDRPFNGVFDHA